MIEAVAEEPGNAGVWFDSETDTFVVSFVDADLERDALLTEVAAPWSLRSVIVRYTRAELEAAAEAVYRYRDDNLVEYGFDVRRNKVLIRVADPAEGLGSMQDRLPEPLDMFCLDSRPAESEPAA